MNTSDTTTDSTEAEPETKPAELTSEEIAQTEVGKEVDPEKFRLHPKDTGSADFQVALLTKNILHLTEHLKIHRKDFSSRRGLLVQVARRRKLLEYIKRESTERHQTIIKALGLRG